MTQPPDSRISTATRTVAAPAASIFELIADPSRQPEWDGNDNLAKAETGQRIRQVGDAFQMETTNGNIRENRVVEFEEGRRIAWLPTAPGDVPPGHLWRWELTPVDDTHTTVTHTYDWTQLHDEKREERARWTTSERLSASIERLAGLAESAN